MLIFGFKRQVKQNIDLNFIYLTIITYISFVQKFKNVFFMLMDLGNLHIKVRKSVMIQ